MQIEINIRYLLLDSNHTRTLQLSEDLYAFKQMIRHLGVWFDTTNEVGSLKNNSDKNSATLSIHK